MPDRMVRAAFTPPSLKDYSAIVEDIRNTINREIGRLRAEWTPQKSEEERAVYMWQVALLTAAWDVSSAANQCCALNEMRAARILDRSLSEYAYNLHFYSRYPAKSVESAAEHATYLRKILKPTKALQGDMTDEQFAAFQTFVSTGSTWVTHEKTRTMRKAALENLGMEASYIDTALAHLESEYAVSSGIAHGSHGLFADVFRDVADCDYHQRSPWFTPNRTAARIASHLILALIAVGAAHGAGMHMRSLTLLVEREPDQSVQVYTENVILSVLAGALRA